MKNNYDQNEIKIIEIKIPCGTTDFINGPKRSIFIVWYKGYFMGQFDRLDESEQYVKRK